MIIHTEYGTPAKSISVSAAVDTNTGNVTASNTDTHTLTPPEGKIWEVVRIRLYCLAPPSATTGSHEFRLFTEDNDSTITVYHLSGESNYNTKLSYTYGRWEHADILQKPADPIHQLQAVEGIVISDTNPLYLLYSNDTDVTQTNPRVFEALVKEINMY